jgi:HSP20 family protein
MAIWGITRDPLWSDFNRLRREMDNLFTSLTGAPRSGGEPLWREVRLFPLLNVRRQGDTFVVSAELPGMKKEDLEIKVEGDTLSLKGERRPRNTEEGVSYHRRERTGGTFQRSLALANRIDADNVKASYRDGVLTITLPIEKAELPKQIAVTTE